jgi:hypothetical protein
VLGHSIFRKKKNSNNSKKLCHFSKNLKKIHKLMNFLSEDVSVSNGFVNNLKYQKSNFKNCRCPKSHIVQTLECSSARGDLPPPPDTTHHTPHTPPHTPHTHQPTPYHPTPTPTIPHQHNFMNLHALGYPKSVTFFGGSTFGLTSPSA